MGNSTEYFVQQLEEVSSEFREIKDDFQPQFMIEELQKVKTKAIAAVVRIVGKESDYYSGIDAILKIKHRNELQIMRNSYADKISHSYYCLCSTDGLDPASGSCNCRRAEL